MLMFRSVARGLKPDRSRLLFIVCALALVLVFTYRLTSLPDATSHQEKTYVSSASSIDSIYHSPSNAPHKLLILAESKAFDPSTASYRIVSVVAALFIALSFFIICRHWFGLPISLMGTAAFVLSPFFIITARQASPEILRFVPITLLAVYYWHSRTDKKDLAWILMMLAAGIALYTPGIFWWLLASAIFARKKLLTTTGRISQLAAATGLLVFILIAIPLVLAFVRDWHFVHQYLLIPLSPPKFFDFLRHLGWMLLALFAKSPYHDELIISRLPLLSVIQLALAVFGGYALFSAARNKAWWLSVSIVFGILLAALNNDVRLLVFSLPAVGVFMAAGLRYLYIEWRSIFPKNPIPKSLALLLLMAAVLIQGVYGVTYSLVAWPNTQPTKAVYVLK